jgi:hypothetical protein
VRSAVSIIDPMVNARALIMPPWSSTYPMALAPTTEPKVENGVAALLAHDVVYATPRNVQSLSKCIRA